MIETHKWNPMGVEFSLWGGFLFQFLLKNSPLRFSFSSCVSFDNDASLVYFTGFLWESSENCMETKVVYHVASVSFSQHAIKRILKYIKEQKELNNEHPHAYHLEFTFNVLLYLFYYLFIQVPISIHQSSFYAFQNFRVRYRHQYN